jgi:hypothetical protein
LAHAISASRAVWRDAIYRVVGIYAGGIIGRKIFRPYKILPLAAHWCVLHCDEQHHQATAPLGTTLFVATGFNPWLRFYNSFHVRYAFTLGMHFTM